jgi:hypothetical protein
MAGLLKNRGHVRESWPETQFPPSSSICKALCFSRDPGSTLVMIKGVVTPACGARQEPGPNWSGTEESAISLSPPGTTWSCRQSVGQEAEPGRHRTHLGLAYPICSC